jgi:hypothetical protein
VFLEADIGSQKRLEVIMAIDGNGLQSLSFPINSLLPHCQPDIGVVAARYSSDNGLRRLRFTSDGR